ncbi:MAG TPA: hypothetical protein VFT95_08430, partial [Micromonosporaceae bacterium]|nr:hypothetical protein [Micromonosporaceae bacterium]
MSPLAAMQHFGGNRAMAALLTEGQAAPQAPPIVTGAPGPAPAPALEDPDFNPTVRAHDLVRAIDSAEHTYRMKSSGLLGSEEDVEAERRKIDFPVVLAALDGLTASQVQKVEEVFYSFDRKATLSECLFGLGESGRRADLTDDQKARLRVLMAGTRPEPIPPHVMAELRRLPPQVAGELKADLEQRADAEPALRRHEADAIELHELLTGDLNEARRERIMAMHRRKPEETRAVDAMYAKNYGAGTLATDLNKRLDGLQRMRMTALRQGDVAQADAFAIEDKRRRIEALNEQDESMSSGFMGGGLHDDVLREQHRRQRQQLTGEIQAIIEQNKQEALTEAVRTGRGAGEAVAERIGKIMEAGVGAPGHTLGADLGRTLGKEDAAVVASLTDVWNTAGSGNLVQAAAAQLAADERAGTTSAKKIMATLQSFRTMAAQDLRAQAFDPRTPVEQKLAIQRDGENGVTRLAQRY